MKVSELCLGTMTLGRELDAEGSKELVARFYEAGGNFLDTADVYGRGDSEEVIGGALKALGIDRDEVVLATKVYGPMSEAADTGKADPNNLGLSRKHVISACEASLRRFGVDHIDLYQVHLWDPGTPLEETLSALTDLVRAGKVRYVGCSNYSAWQTVKALWVSDAKGYERFVSLQPQYSLADRNVEREILPACLEEGIGMIPWSPLGGGFLSGKYRRDEKPPEGSRIAGAVEDMDEHWNRRATERNWQTLEVMGEIADETGRSYAQIALNWLLRQPAVAAPINGARTMEQLEDNLGAAGWALDEGQEGLLSEASALEEVYPNRIVDLLTERYRRA